MTGIINSIGGGVNFPDLTTPATPSDVLLGKQFVDKNGNILKGNIPYKDTKPTLHPSWAPFNFTKQYYQQGFYLDGVDPSLKILMNESELFYGLEFEGYSLQNYPNLPNYSLYFTKWVNSSDFYQSNRCVSTSPIDLAGYKYISIYFTNWMISEDWVGRFHVSLENIKPAPPESKYIDLATHTNANSFCTTGNPSGVESHIATFLIPHKCRVNGVYYLRIEGNKGGAIILYFNKVFLHNKGIVDLI